MRTIRIEYPESIPATLNLSPESFEEEARIALAMKLHEMGRLTSGQAASLAGVSHVAFLPTCRRYGSFSVQWDSEEIEAEFRGGLSREGKDGIQYGSYDRFRDDRPLGDSPVHF
jgi:predicted HTH domain antitoxin